MGKTLDKLEELCQLWEDLLDWAGKNNVSLKGTNLRVGHRFGNISGLYVKDGKVSIADQHNQAWEDMTAPATFTRLRHVIGMAVQYKRFPPYHAKLTQPLSAKLSDVRTAGDWSWSDKDN